MAILNPLVLVQIRIGVFFVGVTDSFFVVIEVVYLKMGGVDHIEQSSAYAELQRVADKCLDLLVAGCGGFGGAGDPTELLSVWYFLTFGRVDRTIMESLFRLGYLRRDAVQAESSTLFLGMLFGRLLQRLGNVLDWGENDIDMWKDVIHSQNGGKRRAVVRLLQQTHFFSIPSFRRNVEEALIQEVEG